MLCPALSQCGTRARKIPVTHSATRILISFSSSSSSSSSSLRRIHLEMKISSKLFSHSQDVFLQEAFYPRESIERKKERKEERAEYTECGRWTGAGWANQETFYSVHLARNTPNTFSTLSTPNTLNTLPNTKEKKGACSNFFHSHHQICVRILYTPAPFAPFVSSFLSYTHTHTHTHTLTHIYIYIYIYIVKASLLL